MNNIDPIEVFPSVEKMLYNLAWKFSNQYRQAFEDMRSIAYMGFMKACNNFRPGKGMKFSSWCYFVTWGSLKSHIMQVCRDAGRLSFVELNEEIVEGTPETPRASVKAAFLLEKVSKHKSLGRILFELFADCPHELLEMSQDISVAGQEMLALFLESPGEVPREIEFQRIKQQVARQFGAKDTEAAFEEICGRLQIAWA